MTSNKSHEITSYDARETVLDMLLSLGKHPSDIDIGHKARCISIMAERTGLSGRLFLSFVKGDGVASREAMAFSVIESIPLMSHLSGREKTATLLSLACAYRHVMTHRLADVIVLSMASIAHPSAISCLRSFVSICEADGIHPSDGVVEDALHTLSIFG